MIKYEYINNTHEKLLLIVNSGLTIGKMTFSRISAKFYGAIDVTLYASAEAIANLTNHSNSSKP